MIGALLGASVLVPAALHDTLLRAAEAGLSEARWSARILEEMRRTLVGEGLVGAESTARLIAALRRAIPEAAVRGFEGRIAAMTNDPKDRHVLAAAVTAGVAVIVTQNVRDFPPMALVGHGIEARTDDAFPLNLWDAEPGRCGGSCASRRATSISHRGGWRMCWRRWRAGRRCSRRPRRRRWDEAGRRREGGTL